MKRIHLIFLIITAFIMLCSAYALAEMSQVHYIEFQCFSSEDKVFKNEQREELPSSEWMSNDYPDEREIKLLTKIDDINYKYNDVSDLNILGLKDKFFEKNMLIYCNMKKRFPEGSKAKVIAMAQRGNTVEIKIDLGCEEDDMNKIYRFNNNMLDIVKVDKEQLYKDKELCFVLKDQNNKELFRRHCFVD